MSDLVFLHYRTTNKTVIYLTCTQKPNMHVLTNLIWSMSDLRLKGRHFGMYSLWKGSSLNVNYGLDR